MRSKKPQNKKRTDGEHLTTSQEMPSIIKALIAQRKLRELRGKIYWEGDLEEMRRD